MIREREIIDQVRAYLAARAVEVWIAEEEGGITIHTAQGIATPSSFGVTL